MVYSEIYNVQQPLMVTFESSPYEKVKQNSAGVLQKVVLLERMSCGPNTDFLLHFAPRHYISKVKIKFPFCNSLKLSILKILT